jgi:hypothetical protein
MEREKMGKREMKNNGKGSGEGMNKCKMLPRNHRTAISGCRLDQTQSGQGRTRTTSFHRHNHLLAIVVGAHVCIIDMLSEDLTPTQSPVQQLHTRAAW